MRQGRRLTNPGTEQLVSRIGKKKRKSRGPRAEISRDGRKRFSGDLAVSQFNQSELEQKSQ